MAHDGMLTKAPTHLSDQCSGGSHALADLYPGATCACGEFVCPADTIPARRGDTLTYRDYIAIRHGERNVTVKRAREIAIEKNDLGLQASLRWLPEGIDENRFI
jgi:hypothetical protein